MMSGPEPEALPMMNRIGLSGYAGWAAVAAEAAMNAGMATVANSLIARMGPSSLFSTTVMRPAPRVNERLGIARSCPFDTMGS
jgi:hypothetical protein